jgi:hypothetical protein
MLMAAFIQFFITYSLAMMAFWILEISTIVFIVYSFEYFLGGQMFPIDIMPPAVQAVMKWLPFYYELFCPIAIFLGRLKGAELVQALTIQTGWLFLAWAGGKLHAETRPRPLPGCGRIAFFDFRIVASVLRIFRCEPRHDFQSLKRTTACSPWRGSNG